MLTAQRLRPAPLLRFPQHPCRLLGGVPSQGRSPPQGTGDPNTAHGDPNTAHGDPNTAHGDPNTAHGDPPQLWEQAGPCEQPVQMCRPALPRELKPAMSPARTKVNLKYTQQSQAKLKGEKNRQWMIPIMGRDNKAPGSKHLALNALLCKLNGGFQTAPSITPLPRQ